MKLPLYISLPLAGATATWLLLVTGGDTNVQDSLVQHVRQLQQNKLVVRVGLADKPTTIQLEECQGDCNRDSDCASGLVCLQRAAGQKVPGCAGESLVNARADFCVQPPPSVVSSDAVVTAPSDDSGSFNPANVHNPNPPRDEWVINPKEVPMHTMPIRMTFGASAKLQLYWEPRAWWQEENYDRRWCMRCRKGCLPGNGLMIVHCDNIPGTNVQVPNLWEFEAAAAAESNAFLVKVNGDNSCLSRFDRWTLQLDTCDTGNRAQQWVATDGSFERGVEFQISPVSHPDWCITQRHHPRSGETVGIEPCTTARKSFTAHWNMY